MLRPEERRYYVVCAFHFYYAVHSVRPHTLHKRALIFPPSRAPLPTVVSPVFDVQQTVFPLPSQIAHHAVSCMRGTEQKHAGENTWSPPFTNPVRLLRRAFQFASARAIVQGISPAHCVRSKPPPIRRTRSWCRMTAPIPSRAK